MRKYIVWLLILTLICSGFTTVLAYQSNSLYPGSSGIEVAAMQEALKFLGYLKSAADGKYGTLTENAVRSFQKSKGLTVDGIAGAKTLGLLFELTQAADTAVSQSSVISSPNGTVSSSVTLALGSKGQSVKALQTALNQLGYPCGSADGSFGNATYKAVIAFQRDHNLTPDGKAGKATLTAINNAQAQNISTIPSAPVTNSVVPASSNAPVRTLKLGMSGSDVKSLQQKLNDKGLNAGSADGRFGTKTLQAVKQFQQSVKLTADGIAGSKTIAALWSTQNTASSATLSGSETASNVSTYRSLSMGESGDEVKTMQKALMNLGYQAAADGVFGAQTKLAVTAFQKQNGLTQDGVAGSATLALLYSGKALSFTQTPATDTAIQKGGGPASGQVQLLHWFKQVKPSLKTGNQLFVYDPVTQIHWTLRVLACGNHCDAEPLTLADTESMLKAFGNIHTWTPKAVYVKLPGGTWTLAATHDVPHLSGSIKNNGFDGHLCVHFLRDLEETQKNDPNYGMTNQKTIRSAWKALTGVDYKD